MLDVSIRIGILNLMIKLKEERNSRSSISPMILRARATSPTSSSSCTPVRSSSAGRWSEVLPSPSIRTPSSCSPRPGSCEAHRGRSARAVEGVAAARSTRPTAAASPRGVPSPWVSARRSRRRSSRRVPNQIARCHVTAPSPDLTAVITRGTPMRSPQFPSGFVWGAATAAYQIEGAATEDGRGESIWDRFARHPGRSRRRHRRVACDPYHRYAEDVRLMRELGLEAYRFSVAWPRDPPRRPRAREPGRARLLRPSRRRPARERHRARSSTLYHWDLPQVLEDRGGWPARDTVEAFTDTPRWSSRGSATVSATGSRRTSRG